MFTIEQATGGARHDSDGLFFRTHARDEIAGCGAATSTIVNFCPSCRVGVGFRLRPPDSSWEMRRSDLVIPMHRTGRHFIAKM